jgi:hypothetical protein
MATKSNPEHKKPAPRHKEKITPMRPVFDRNEVGEEKLIDGLEDHSSARFTEDVESDEDTLFNDEEARNSIRISPRDDDRVPDLESLREELKETNTGRKGRH